MLRRSIIAIFAALLFCSSASAATSITDRLTADRSAIEVTSEPVGTVYVHVAAMKNLAGEGTIYYNVPASQLTIKPPSKERPVLAVQAFSSSYTAIGGFTSRLKTEEPKFEEKLPKEEEIPIEPKSLMATGIDSGGWYLPNDSALTAGKLKLARYQNISNEEITQLASHGWKIIDLFGHNPATKVNASLLASEAATRAKAHPNIVATEILNEPQNPYLGGSQSQENIEAYARVVNVVTDRFAAEGIKSVPLWSADGGYAGVPSWGAKVWPLLDATTKRIARATTHPYGGTGSREKSALGGRNRVEESFRLTGHKGWTTEIGWPTAVGKPPTGDSLQWTESEQAHNIESFIRWAPTYDETVMIFQYRDYGTNNFYGIETQEGKHKQSFAVLESLTE